MFVQHSPTLRTSGRRRRGALAALVSAAALLTVGAAATAPASAAPAGGVVLGADAEGAIKDSHRTLAWLSTLQGGGRA